MPKLPEVETALCGIAPHILHETITEIPFGKVATYGQIVRLVGREKNAHWVGSVLRHAADYGDYPCHRVVNAVGRLVPGWAAQADLLRDEGVELKDETHVCLKRYQWDC